MTINRQGFFDTIRGLFGGHFTQPQIDGMTAILDSFERSLPQGDVRWLAYMLATTFHETARTMQPVREAFWLSEDWRRRNLRYYPYYGRGYVQLTWKENYERAGVVVGANLVSNPDLAMRPDIAAVVMLAGMTQGWFRRDNKGRHTLARYFSGSTNDPSGAREIINGKEFKTINGVRTLIADVIARYHTAFLRALGAQAPRAKTGFRLAPAAAPPVLDFVNAGAPDMMASAYSFADEAPDVLEPGGANLVEMTTMIVTGFVSKNEIKIADVDDLIETVHDALSRISGRRPADQYSIQKALDDADAVVGGDDDPHPTAPSRRKKAS